VKGVLQRSITPKSEGEREIFLQTYPAAKSLVSGINPDGTETEILNALANNFSTKSGFTYTMTQVSPEAFLKGTAQGDCNTLSRSFVIIATDYFGIGGIGIGSKGKEFGVPGPHLVIDSAGSTGNVDNGGHWAFTSHTWVVGPDKDRDILFRGADLDQSNWIDKTGDGVQDGIPYRLFETLGGGRVYDNKLFGPLATRYTTSLETAQGSQAKIQEELDTAVHSNKTVSGSKEIDQKMGSLGMFGGSKKSSSKCFITTACVEAKGLPDDCEELTVLRQFRDDYMSAVEHGSEMIDEYYAIAPEIVNRISALPNGERIFVNLYDKVAKSVHLVKAGQNEEAMQNYISIVRELKKQYLET
jgi:hypothetical protein